MAGEYLRESYPLRWPERHRRTPREQRRSASFKVALGIARDDLMRELKLLGAKDIIVSTNVPTRRDGLLYSDAREPDDPGVAVYFDRMVPAPTLAEPWRKVARPYAIACDCFRKLAWNIRAIGLTVEALRAIQRHGAGEMLEQAFTGFAALPPASSGRKPWWEVLGVPRGSHPDTITETYRALAALNHPDRGGDPARMTEINVAYDEARKEHAA